MFKDVKISHMTPEDWKKKFTDVGTFNLKTFVDEQMSLCLIELDPMAYDDETSRPNRLIAFRAILEFVAYLSTSEEKDVKVDIKMKRGQLLKHILSTVAGVTAGRGSRSLQIHTVRALVGDGYYARSYTDPIYQITWSMQDLLKKCNEIYQDVNCTAPSITTPPNWLSTFSILTKSSQFLTDITKQHRTIPALDANSGVWQDNHINKRWFVELDFDGQKYHTLVASEKDDVDLHLSIVNTWSARHGHVIHDATIKIPTTSNFGLRILGSAVSATILATLATETTWPYSEHWLGAGATGGDEIIFKYLACTWWIENLKSRARALENVPLTRRAAIIDTFETHQYEWHIRVLFPAILRSCAFSLFNVNPDLWIGIAKSVAEFGSDLLIFLTTIPTGVAKSQDGFDKSIVASFVTALRTTTTPSIAHAYGMWRKGVRVFNSEPKAGQDRPTQPTETFDLGISLGRHFGSKSVTHKVIFGLMRTMPTLLLWAKDEDKSAEGFSECDDLFLNLDQAKTSLKSALQENVEEVDSLAIELGKLQSQTTDKVEHASGGGTKLPLGPTAPTESEKRKGLTTRPEMPFERYPPNSEKAIGFGNGEALTRSIRPLGAISLILSTITSWSEMWQLTKDFINIPTLELFYNHYGTTEAMMDDVSRLYLDLED